MTTRSAASGADLYPHGRRGHSIGSAIRDFFLVWYAMLAGILLWAIHLVALASLVQLSCNNPGTDWITHTVTAVTLAGTVLAIVLSVRLLRTGKEQLALTSSGSGSGSGDPAITEAHREDPDRTKPDPEEDPDRTEPNPEENRDREDPDRTDPNFGDFHPDDFDSGSTPPQRLIFMGRFGILIGSISALLIVMEEVYAVALHSTTCA
ncbi:MAG: hypothetical protein WBF71_12785 [Microthrixaceae bacterium]